MWDIVHRPKNFASLLGNAGIVKLLKKRSVDGTLVGRSMMFGGPKGLGKTTLARIVAKAIICPNLQDGEPCCECGPCKSVEEGISDSFDELDAATQGTVDRIRSIVQDLDLGTIDGNPRVVVFDEAQRLSKASQDALLKPMEDRRLVIILCTTEPHSIKTAIRDRVEEYSVSPPSVEDITNRLKFICKSESVEYDVDALDLIVMLNHSNPRTSITSLETISMMGKVTRDAVRDVFRFDSMEDVVKVLSLIDSDPVQAFSVLDGLFSRESPTWIRDNIVAAVSSALRSSVGAKSTYSVPTMFFQNRGRAWAELASSLSRIDRPDAAAVEAVLMETSNALPTVFNIPPSPSVIHMPSIKVVGEVPVIELEESPALGVARVAGLVKKADPSQQELVAKLASAIGAVKKPESKIKESNENKSVEVDGVMYTSSEVLTSLDAKIKSSAPPENPIAVSDAKVLLNGDLNPIPPREFSREFESRFKKTSR
jgi:DNA polymerase III subunit gamma/tau